MDTMAASGRLAAPRGRCVSTVSAIIGEMVGEGIGVRVWWRKRLFPVPERVVTPNL